MSGTHKTPAALAVGFVLLVVALLALAIAISAATLVAQQPAQPQPTAKDSAWAARIITACDEMGNWREGQRPSWHRAAEATCKANADSSRKATAVVPPPVVNQPPVASFPTPTCVNTTRTCTVNGSTSADPDGTIATYRWTWGDGSTTTGVTSSHAYTANGTFSVALMVTDDKGLTSAPLARNVTILLPVPPDTTPLPLPPVDTVSVVLAELPRSTPDATPKACTQQKDLNPTASDLQAAINAAVPGDCLNLPPGSEWKGNFVLPDRCVAGTGWITLQTKGVTDKPGVRVTRAEAGAFAKLTQTYNQAAISAGHPSCRWNFLHLNIQADPTNVNLIYHLAVFGDGGWSGAAEENVSADKQPTDFILRRSWVHGHANTNLVRCVVLNGVRQAVVDNIIEDCHANGFDSQAVEGWNGFGPFLLENNFASASAENIMFGGADPAIPNLSPSDITIRRNHIWKDPAWMGGPWTVKNLFELKNARRVLVESNVFENNWIHAQMGMAIVIKSSGDANAANTRWQGTTDVTFRYNIVHNSHRGLNLQAVDCSGQTCVDEHVKRVTVEHNRFSNIGNSLNATNGSDGWLMLLTHDLRDVLIRFNTIVGNRPGAGLAAYLDAPQYAMQNVRILNNVLAGQSYYHLAAANAPGCCQKALEYVAAPGEMTFAGNVISAVEGQFQTPGGNTYFDNISGIGLTSDYRVPNHPGKGADITAINTRTAGVVQPALVTSRRMAGRPRTSFPVTLKDVEYMARQPKSR